MNNEKGLFEPKLVNEEKEMEERKDHKKKLLDNDELKELDEKIVEPRLSKENNEIQNVDNQEEKIEKIETKNSKKNLLAIYVTLAIVIGLVVLYFVVFKE